MTPSPTHKEGSWQEKFQALPNKYKVFMKPIIDSLLAAEERKVRETTEAFRKKILKDIEYICDEETMDRIWKSNKQAKYILPNYEPHCATFSVNVPYDKKYSEMTADEIRCEMYECGFVRGETWGAQKIKRTLLTLLSESYLEGKHN